MAPLGGITRTSKCMSRTFSWRSAPWDTSQHARLDLLEGPHTLGDVLEDVRLVLAAPSTRFCGSRPRPTGTSLSGSGWLLGLLVADTSLLMSTVRPSGKDNTFMYSWLCQSQFLNRQSAFDSFTDDFTGPVDLDGFLDRGCRCGPPSRSPGADQLHPQRRVP